MFTVEMAYLAYRGEVVNSKVTHANQVTLRTGLVPAQLSLVVATNEG